METDYTDELMEEMGTLQEELDHAGAWDLDAKIDQAMDALRCPPGDPAVDILSGGERRRVALCQLLLSAPDLLLLDEPTNHLDAESVQWLEQFLASYPGAVLAVTHDRYFLDNVAQWIAEVDRGRLIPYEGNYSTYLEKKSERMTVEGRKDVKLAKRLKEELAWVRSGAKARQAKSKSPGSPATRRWPPRPSAPASSISRRSRSRRARGWVPSWSRCDDLKKGFDDRVLIDDLSFTLPRNGIVGVIGPNGVGKTTLFKTIVGLEKPDNGNVKIGETVKLSYVDQNRGRARPEEERLAGGLRRPGLHQGRQRRDALPGLRFGVRVQGTGPAEAVRRAVRRGAQPAQPGADAQGGRQPDPARRADQRPGRRDARLARARAGAIPGLRGGDLPRPLVPGSDLHPHPGLGGHRRGPVDAGTSSRATSPTTRRTRSSRLGADAARPHRVTHRKLTRS